MSNLVRFGVSIDENLLHKFDKMINGVYANRSEAIRDLIREKIVEEEWQTDDGEVVGSLTLIYDHHQRGLTEKMLKLQHNYHYLFKSNLHLHLNHDCCLEVIVIQGRACEVKKVANMLIGLKGVKYGKLTISTNGQAF
ncbi:nickel-responsive regulator [Anoxybacter fermentans]|uniref:Putative nickel-responsive regulator n=1 Tax=Anoxybacter fermentans TaxID=1323375 RepID=A0A3S9SWJ2_9FIRM|nr:nickel-responsive transcriptional regulator NikR [Anoxybacter fermentans]AZR72612.1 nickel-responsive regulator [Anoxybacter fermentans]